MNRNQRRGKAPRRNESSNRCNSIKCKGATDNQQVVGAAPQCCSSHRSRKEEKHVTKQLANRCCYVTPRQTDFGQSYKISSTLNRVNKRVVTEPTEEHRTRLAKQYGFEPIPVSLTQLKKALRDNTAKVENSSQYDYQESGSPPTPAYVETSDGTQWQNVDTIEDVDKIYMKQDGMTNIDPPYVYECLPRHTFISEVPHVKIIAEKYSKYKKNNIEIRRLDEKVICVEYDVYQTDKDILKPVQSMRAYFSIKPICDVDVSGKEVLPKLSSNIKHKLDITDEDLKQLTEKEIEIIDDTIEGNKSYLENLMRILNRKRKERKVIDSKKNKTSLDLNSLYEMAKKEVSSLDSDNSELNLLSKAELQEVKDMILQKSISSIRGIRRTRVKSKENGTVDTGLISESIVAELLRDDANLSVLQ